MRSPSCAASATPAPKATGTTTSDSSPWPPRWAWPRPERPDKVAGWSDCQITDETAAAYGDVISAIDSARLPFLPDGAPPGSGDGGSGGEGRDDTGGKDKPKKRGGRREAVECACQPARRLQLSPKQREDGPVICGLCGEPFELPEPADADTSD